MNVVEVSLSSHAVKGSTVKHRSGLIASYRESITVNTNLMCWSLRSAPPLTRETRSFHSAAAFRGPSIPLPQPQLALSLSFVILNPRDTTLESCFPKQAQWLLAAFNHFLPVVAASATRVFTRIVLLAESPEEIRHQKSPTTAEMKENERPTLATSHANGNGHAATKQTHGQRQRSSLGQLTVSELHLQNRPVTPTVTPAQAQAAAKKYKHAFAVHSKLRISPLSSDATESVSLQGFKNLAFAVLACSILRLMIENFKKYGVRVTLSSNGPDRSDIIYGTILYLTVPCHLFVAYGIELVAAIYAQGAMGRVKKSESTDRDRQLEWERKRLKTLWWGISGLHALNATCNLMVSSAVVWFYIKNPGIGTIHEMHAVIVWLKVSSYAFANRDLRHAFLKPDPTGHAVPELYRSCPYPRNITVSNLCYFWWAPTLIYQPAYPRTDKIRWVFVAKRMGEVIIACFVIWIASAQYAVPLLQNLSLIHI